MADHLSGPARLWMCASHLEPLIQIIMIIIIIIQQFNNNIIQQRAITRIEPLQWCKMLSCVP